ncbi:pentatricopeptide repeat-containing protein At1g80270, mitochondrial [Neltuma alba]|uniref:pentatricopeptide repeat-containing protein At1g80270, mitochondrial-like n=1 Tax=Neltuma alba TaxID=207710 RepID=UPI0010A41A1F|nr:pentatricopeptide repeat-containing protein At1g80270, mitochondrial-like [Prosopis alba]XP_028761755.1 pentatricopeptide repeat-containing protein At1g80270, mitochondrial-like [Prosopis alba]
MWALRRASIPLRSRGLKAETARACLKLTPSACVEDEGGVSECCPIIYGRSPSLNTVQYHSGYDSLKFIVSRRELSSQADARNTKEEEDGEDGFSELGATTGENNDELISKSDLSGDDEDTEEPQNELELSDTDTESTEKKSPKGRRAQSEMLKEILEAPVGNVRSTMDKWVEQGKEVERKEISLVMLMLRKRKLYGKALQLSEWLEEKKILEFTEREYTSRVDLFAKLHGLHKAENYIESIPESFRGEVVYRTLLANCVSQTNVKKAEHVFNKMRDLEFPLSAFACNQLLLLYQRIDKKKIADVLLLMERENIKPSPFTYQILIDAKGQANDIAGMDQIVETMKAEGIEPDIQTKAVLAKHYASAGLKEKAEDVLREMEGEDLKENRWVCRFLLPLYGGLGKTDEVGRIWEVCKSNPRSDECLAAIEAWGRLKKVEEAEKVFEIMLNKWKKLSSRDYTMLLKVYANNKMLMKGKDLIRQMADSGTRIGPLTWDSIVKLYVQAGEVEKADSVLQKAVQQNHMKPMFCTYMLILNKYAQRGDIHNSEKIFYRMRQSGYGSRLSLYQALVQAYINAKQPAYGMRERLKADDVFPNKSMAGLLAQVDAFRKTAVSDLLD